MVGNRSTSTSGLFATILAPAAVALLLTGCDSSAGTRLASQEPVVSDSGRVQSVAASAEPVREGQDRNGASAAGPDAPVAALRPEISTADPSANPAAADPTSSDPEGGAEPTASEPPISASSEEPEAEVDASKYPGGIIPASPNAKPLPGGPRLLVPNKTFRTDGKPPALRVSYDDLDLLKVLNVDPVPTDVLDQFPEWLSELDGKQIRIRGFMYPAYEEMLSSFVLTRDTGECCFGPKAKVYYLIGVKLKENTQVRYVQNRPIDVVGTFHIQPVVSDGQWFQIYKITDAAVVD